MSIAQKLTEIAENVPKVFEAGKKAEYDTFWDSFQQNGNRRQYINGFYSSCKCWSKANFKPKYDIICEGDTSRCFYAWESLPEGVNIGAILKEQGVTLDTSKATNMTAFMAYGYDIIGELPTISFESAGANTTGALRSVAVTKIEKLIVTEQTNFSNMFLYCYNLKEIEFEGTVANDKLDLSYSKALSAQSLESVILALSTETSALTVKLPNTAQATYDAANGDGAWEALLATRQNWRFEYA